MMALVVYWAVYKYRIIIMYPCSHRPVITVSTELMGLVNGCSMQ